MRAVRFHSPKKVSVDTVPVEEAAHGYGIFNDKQDGCVKVVLRP